MEHNNVVLEVRGYRNILLVGGFAVYGVSQLAKSVWNRTDKNYRESDKVRRIK